MRVFSKSYLVEAGKSYQPGDEITGGQLFEFASYYARIGHVRVTYDANETIQPVLSPTEIEKVEPKEPDRAPKPVRRGRPKKKV